MDGAPQDVVAPSATTEVPLRGSFAANLAGFGWHALLQIAFTPLFIRAIGAEGYGVIGFGITLIGLVQVLDFGFAPTINRWLARFSAGHEDEREARDMARTLETGSWCIAVVAGVAMAALAGPIGRSWLESARISSDTLRSALMLAAVNVSVQLPILYYQAGLRGLRRAYAMNALRAIAATASLGGAALLLFRLSPSVTTYFAVHAAVACAHVLVLRSLFWRTLSPERTRIARFRPAVLRTAWRFTAGMSAIVVGGVVASHADRLIVVRMVSLHEFGSYALAWTVATGLGVISVPAMHTLFPQLSETFASGDATALRATYHKGAQVLSALLLPVASVMILFAEPALEAWTGSRELARDAAPLAMLLATGVALNGLMQSVYALQLAAGATRLAWRLTILQVVVVVPLVVMLASRYGVVGAASAWAIMNVVYFAAGSVATFRQVLPGAWSRWVFDDVCVPLTAALVIAIPARAFLPLPSSRAGAIIAIMAIFLVTAASSAFATRTTRAAMFPRL
jgi:O-antigen/teichoic acid export membrane protein